MIRVTSPGLFASLYSNLVSAVCSPRSGSVNLRVVESRSIPLESYVLSVASLALTRLLRFVAQLTDVPELTPLGGIDSSRLFLASYLSRLTGRFAPAVGGGPMVRVRLPRLPDMALPE